MLVSAAWIGPAVLAAINEIAQRRLTGQPPPSVAAVLFAGGDWLVYALLTPGVFVAAARWPLTQPHLRRHALIHAALSLGYCVAWAGAGALLRKALVPDTLWGTPGEHFISWLFITLPFGVAIYLALVGIEHGIRYFLQAREREVQVARLSEQLTGARYAALQARLNPHFLFNTLNTIAVLVRDADTRRATRIVEHLGALLRRTLGRHRTDEVPLEEEMQLVADYLAIEQERYSDRLRTVIDVPSSLGRAAVPGFSVQHLAENAIRHGVARRSDAGLLSITARADDGRLVVVVEDDGAGVAMEPAPKPGHGLENTRDRLRSLYGEDASLTVTPRGEGGTRAELVVPYRELPEADRGDA